MNLYIYFQNNYTIFTKKNVQKPYKPYIFSRNKKTVQTVHFGRPDNIRLCIFSIFKALWKQIILRKGNGQKLPFLIMLSAYPHSIAEFRPAAAIVYSAS